MIPATDLTASLSDCATDPQGDWSAPFLILHLPFPLLLDDYPLMTVQSTEGPFSAEERSLKKTSYCS